MFKTSDQAGFSLIELIIVMAITASLAMIAFVGQRGLRSQAQFDTSIDKIVSSVADAYNQAAAGVNVKGAGDGASGCAGSGSGNVFAGVAWSADNSLPNTPIRISYYKTIPGGTACEFDARTVTLSPGIQVNPTNPPATQGGRMLFVRNDKGGIYVCPMTLLTADVLPSFSAGSCAVGAKSFRFQDNEGHTSQITIDQSGLARRDF